MAETRLSDASAEVRHEESDVNVRAILWFVVIFIISAGIIHVAVWGLFVFFADLERAKTPPPVSLVKTKGPLHPPEPRLQDDPVRDMKQMRVDEKRAVDSYGWVDQEKGIVRIPVKEAMKVVVQRGLPVRQAPVEPMAAPTVTPPPPPPVPPAEGVHP